MQKNIQPTGLTQLGKTINTPVKNLETFTAPEYIQVVEFSTGEFTCNCPKTGQPDFYTLKIKYRPSLVCIESKSLKMYLWTYRDQGHFIESLACLLADDLIKSCRPEWITVELIMAPRGGIAMKAMTGFKYDTLMEMYAIIDMGPKGSK